MAFSFCVANKTPIAASTLTFTAPATNTLQFYFLFKELFKNQTINRLTYRQTGKVPFKAMMRTSNTVLTTALCLSKMYLFWCLYTMDCTMWRFFLREWCTKCTWSQAGLLCTLMHCTTCVHLICSMCPWTGIMCCVYVSFVVEMATAELNFEPVTLCCS